MIIGLTGTNGAGKGTVADILKEKGFEYHSLSDIIREETRNRGLDENRDNLIAIGNELREKEGPGTLAIRTLKKFEVQDRNFIVDSIRNPSEIEELKKNKSFKLIAVDAPIELRYNRIKGRNRASDFVSFEKFKEQEESELKGGETSQQLVVCMQMADFNITNELTIDDLKKKVEDVLGGL
ncbi:AAA family ATPase [candidate division KSB1 bacterium]